MIFPIAFVEPVLEVKSLQLLYFIAPTDRKVLPNEESDKLQSEHLNNLQRLWGERKVLVCGPFGDNAAIRGLCIMDVGSAKNAEKIMEADAWVGKGQLLAQAVALEGNAAEFVKVDGLFEMREYWFVTAKPAKKKPSDRDQAVADRLRLSWAARGDLLFWGKTKGRDARTVLIFRKMPQEEVAQAVAQLPLGEAEFRPWWTAKGQFRSETR
ncbi:MAG: hypothetical protein JNJ45_01305 [Chthonomonas sp.]|nr:hypothetical protein [Chthonomonas sp.]